MVKWDDSKPGFVGDDNIYGLGIRIGYYSQAVSIWVANSYARHEAPYLHTLTIVFLFALFVGVCQLSATPSNTYAVEPFMLVTIADHTFYLGLWDPEPPYRLRWEVDFRKRFAVMILWLAFTFFDTWYWWSGVWQMKPSDGPVRMLAFARNLCRVTGPQNHGFRVLSSSPMMGLGTVVFFPYVGNTPLLGPDEWISIAARAINAILIVLLTMGTILLCCGSLQQQKLSAMINAERLKLLASRWLKALGSHRDVHVEHQIQGQDANVISTDAKEYNEQHKLTSSGTESLPPYNRPLRTGTGLLKAGLWRRMSNKDLDFSVPPPEYVLYEPSFDQINTAYDFLKDTTDHPEGKKKEPFKGATIFIMWFYPIWWFGDFFYYLALQCFHPYRPGVILAMKSHAAAIRYGCDLTYAKCFRIALRHPKYRQVTSKDIGLASRIILSTEPPARPSRYWKFAIGWGMIGACSVLIIATELTIQWNKIQGVQNLSSVGQLVPFTLGVGSLLKIVWSAVAHRGKGPEEFCYYDHCVNTGIREKWQAAGKKFLEARETAEMRQGMVVRGERKGGSSDDKC